MAGWLALIRHAESTWNADGRWQGHGDPSLSRRGREQAEAMAHELGPLRFGLVVTSDLARAIETGAPLARALGVDSHAHPGLRELDLGSWTGLTRPEIAARDPEALSRFESGCDDAPAGGGGETRGDLDRRARASLAELRARHPDLRIAVVTHLGVIRAILGEELRHASWRWLRKAPYGPRSEAQPSETRAPALAGPVGAAQRGAAERSACLPAPRPAGSPR